MKIIIDSEKLGEMVEETLKDYRFPDLFCAELEGVHYPLYEMLRQGQEPIEKAYDRIHDIADAIISDVIDYAKERQT